MLELKPVSFQHVYEIEGDLQSYTVYCAKDNEFNSWSASVTVQDWGYTTPEAAIEGLVPALESLLKKIKEK